MHEVLVNRLGGLSLPRKSVVRLSDRPDMTLDVTVDVKQQYNVAYYKQWKYKKMYMYQLHTRHSQIRLVSLHSLRRIKFTRVKL